MLHTRPVLEAAAVAVSTQINEKVLDCMRRHAASVEDLCLQAAARGDGWRVWISAGRLVEGGEGARLVYDTAFLPPGSGDAPGLGVVYGPFNRA
jgi:hypothetical protein